PRGRDRQDAVQRVEGLLPEAGRGRARRRGLRQDVAGHPAGQLRRAGDDHSAEAGPPAAVRAAQCQPADVDRGPRGARGRRRRDGPRQRDLGRLRAYDDRRVREAAQGRRAGGGAGDARGPGGIRMIREVAWRLFASEYNDANLEAEGTGERPPSYVVTPLGAKVNRVFVVGVITDVENVGTDGQPMWRARVSDPTGTFHVYAGQYQPEAASALSKLQP